MNLQQQVKKTWEERGYTSDLLTLSLILCEEAGEVGKAVNFYHNHEYKPAADRPIPDNLEHELYDCLNVICAIANASGIIIQWEKSHEDTPAL